MKDQIITLSQIFVFHEPSKDDYQAIGWYQTLEFCKYLKVACIHNALSRDVFLAPKYLKNPHNQEED